METSHPLPFTRRQKTNWRIKTTHPQHHTKNAHTTIARAEKSGVIVRKVYEQIPPKVEYSLSEYGESLSEILNKLCLWGENHVDLLLTKNEDIVLLKRD